MYKFYHILQYSVNTRLILRLWEFFVKCTVVLLNAPPFLWYNISKKT